MPDSWPNWLTPGTLALDKDGDLVVFLGRGGFRDIEYVKQASWNRETETWEENGGRLPEAICFPTDEILFAFRYKKEWFFKHADIEYANSLRPYTGDVNHCWDPPRYGTDLKIKDTKK